jgi:glycosyltransferase involved in cell wall biosynthesis
MPTYNRADIIGASIRSVLNQSFQDLELIVVDDRSTDDTRGEVERIGDPRIIYVWNEGSKGPSGARNRGIVEARGEWVALIDSDDEWSPTKLELQVQALTGDPNLDGVGCGWRWKSGTTGETRVVRIPDSMGRIDGLPRWAFNTCPEHLVRSEMAKATPFDEDLWTYECMEWVLRLSKKCRFGYIPRVLVHCNDHEGDRASDGHLRLLKGLEEVMIRHERFIREDREAWSALNLQLGAGYLVAGGDRQKARKRLASSLRSRPTALRAWVYAAGSAIPSGPLLIRGVRRMVGNSFRNRERT